MLVQQAAAAAGDVEDGPETMKALLNRLGSPFSTVWAVFGPENGIV